MRPGGKGREGGEGRPDGIQIMLGASCIVLLFLLARKAWFATLRQSSRDFVHSSSFVDQEQNNTLRSTAVRL